MDIELQKLELIKLIIGMRDGQVLSEVKKLLSSKEQDSKKDTPKGKIKRNYFY